MIRTALMASLLALVSGSASAHNLATTAASTAAYSDLHGKQCRTIDSSARGGTRHCSGVAGYSVLVHDDDDRTSVDVVAPGKAVYPLAFWDVVTLGYASVGQKAEWRMARRNGKSVPTALLVRLTRLDTRNPGELIAVARLDRDGACVVFKGDMADPGVEGAARQAAADPGSRCLGAYTPD